MFITLLLPSNIFGSASALMRRSLRSCGIDASVVRGPADSSLLGLDLLIRFEAFLPGRAWHDFSSIDGDVVAVAEPRSGALKVDLGQAPAEGAIGILCNGCWGIAGVVAAALSGGPCDIAVIRRSEAAAEPVVLAHGTAISQNPRQFTATLEGLCLRVADLIGMAARANERGDAAAPWSGTAETANLTRLHYGSFAVAALARRIAERLDRLVRHPDHWTVCWRADAQADLVSTHLAWPRAAYRRLVDDGARYYADPFLFERDGRCFLFVEELPYATCKGILSVTEIVPGEGPGVPRPILEGPVHLSYPQVFEHDGQVWMIPETCGAQTIELYRAVAFPDRWVREAVLVSDIDASDATLLIQGGHFWIFAALHPWNSSSHDMLGIFHAASLTGPWTPHMGSPVLIDAGAARPGGAFFRHGGDLMRVAQDCTAGYGAGLTICRVDRLDETHFAQSVVARLRPLPDWPASGVHTLNSAGGFEVIDIVARKWKL